MERVPGIQASQMIPGMVKQLYIKVGKQMGMDPNTLFRSGQCENMTDELVLALRRKGVEARIATYNKGWTVLFHDFVIFVEDGEDWIADPTWQQFLDQPDPSLPNVFLSKKSDLAATLSKLGVPLKKHDIWFKAREMNL